MGVLALIPYSVIKELCSSVKRDKKSFVGKIKTKKRNYDRPPYPVEKVNHVKRLLLSAKRQKRKAETEKQGNSGVKKAKNEPEEQSDESGANHNVFFRRRLAREREHRR